MRTDLAGEERLVIQLVLNPSHEIVDVLGGRALDGLLDRLPVRPVVLVLGSGGHDGAPLLRARLRDCPVQHVDLVEEVDGVDGHPLVQVLALRQNDCQPQVA